MYKLVAIDMDGTLLRKDGTISKLTKETIRQATRLGIKIVLTSGRPIQGLKKYLNELDLVGEEDYVITNNGGAIYSTKDYSVISTNGITGKELKEIYKISQVFKVHLHGFIHEACLVKEENLYTEIEKNEVTIPLKIVDFESDINDKDEILKAIFVEEKSILDRVTKELPKELFEKYNIARSLDFMLEFGNKKCSKALGLKILGDYLGIKREEIISIGDAANDMEMIDYAGLGIAMGNAIEDIKNKADYITRSNEEDGVSHAIRKFCLKEVK